jgi:hypothetical protein
LQQIDCEWVATDSTTYTFAQHINWKAKNGPGAMAAGLLAHEFWHISMSDPVEEDGRLVQECCTSLILHQ